MTNSRRKKYQNRKNLEQRFFKQKKRNVLAEPGPRELVIILDGLKPNYNIGKIFRSADAFGINKVHLIGIDMFDPAPAKGTFRSVPAVFDENFAACHKTLTDEGYEIFFFSPQRGTPLNEVALPVKCGFVFGHEEFGFSFDTDSFPGVYPVSIPQVGKVDSLNVSIAASIAMYEYARQHPITNTDK